MKWPKLNSITTQDSLKRTNITIQSFSKHAIIFWEGQKSLLPESTSNIELAKRFSTFFTNKILNIHQHLVENNASLEHNIDMAENKLPCEDSFSFFCTVSL